MSTIDSLIAAASAPAKPLPVITPLEAPFWEYCRLHKLSVQCCDDCGDIRFPPSPVCTRCLSSNQGWEQVSGLGTLASWVEFHRAYWPGFVNSLPYTVCMVQLREGPVLASNLIGGSECARVGAQVRVVFRPVSEAITMPMFELVPAAEIHASD